MKGGSRGCQFWAGFNTSIRYVASLGWKIFITVGLVIDCGTYSPSTPVWLSLRLNFAIKE